MLMMLAAGLQWSVCLPGLSQGCGMQLTMPEQCDMLHLLSESRVPTCLHMAQLVVTAAVVLRGARPGSIVDQHARAALNENQIQSG